MSAPSGNGDAPPAEQPEKPKRGKPKDPDAPPKPKNAYQKITGEARAKIKEERPELSMDLKGMAEALKAEWDKTPQDVKDKIQAEYEAEMAIWKPKWAAYKQTDGYKKFFEIKQDWIDARMKKKLYKKERKEGPKRPQSGYMLFAGTIRERVKEEVQAKGGGMGDIGVQISQEWNALSETKKAEFGEVSQRQKEKFNVEYTEYKTTDKFLQFCDDKANLEAKQRLRKIMRTKLDEKPDKAPGAFGLFRKEVAEEVREELAKKGKIELKEMARAFAERWSAVPDAKKEEYQKEAERLKEIYDEKMSEFKKSTKFTEFIEDRKKIKDRQNLMIGLRDMPKRPRSVFAMYAEEHKSEVPAGKGEGKGRSALKVKFEQAAAEEKAKLEAIVKESTDKWKQDVNAYKEGDKYKGFVKNQDKIKMEFMNEAMKVMTLRFLSAAPAQPPKSAFGVYAGRKRKAQIDDGQKRDKKQKLQDIEKWKQEFSKLDKDTKMEYESERQEKIKVWTEECKEYVEKPIWKEYVAEAKRLRVPVKSILSNKNQVIKRLKNGMRVVALPPRPESHPAKAPGAYKLFVMDKKRETPDIEPEKVKELWNGLDAEAKKFYVDKATQSEQEYKQELAEFRKSEEGKTYLRSLVNAMRLRRSTLAKFKYLKDMPKKPPAAVQVYMKKELAAMKKKDPDAKGFELKKTITEKWTAMSDEERQALSKEADQKVKEYEESLASFKDSENWKAYIKMVKPKAKAQSLKAPPPPKEMPERPADGYKAFQKEHTGEGKGLAELAKMWAALSQEEKDERKKADEERLAKWREEMKDFEKTPEGKKYLVAQKMFARRKRVMSAKLVMLRKEPKPPPSAEVMFANEKRADVNKEHPGLKATEVQAKLDEMYKALSDDDRQSYENKHKEAMEKFEKDKEAFKTSPAMRNYEAAKKGGAPGAKAKAKAVPSVPKPDNLPKKAPNAMQVFMEKSKIPGGLGKAAAAWRELGAEGQKEYVQEAQELATKYAEDMKAFNTSAEGKRYNRLKAAADQVAKKNNLKAKFLGGNDMPKEPKRPPNAYFLFVDAKRKEVKGSMTEVAKQLKEIWQGYSPDEKKVFEDKAAEAKKEYDAAVAEFKANPNYQKFQRAMGNTAGVKRKVAAPKKAKSKAKAKGKASAKGRAAPKAAAKKDDSDDDVMGSDSSDSSSSNSSD